MIYIVNNLKQVNQACLTLFYDGYRDFHPVRNIELLSALPLKVNELLLIWYPFSILCLTLVLSMVWSSSGTLSGGYTC